jgi:formylmethanofuran dehydrogenase subunit E
MIESIGQASTSVTAVPYTLLKDAVKMHGHLGPFLVIGLKMSLLAERILLGKPESCTASVMQRKPYLCSIDGVKAVLNVKEINVSDGEGISAVFNREDSEVEINVRENIIRKYGTVPWERCEEYAEEVQRLTDHELFTFAEHKLR